MRDSGKCGGKSLFRDKPSQRRRSTDILQLEWLENRNLMSATASPDLKVLSTGSTPVGLSPSEIKTAYSFPVSGSGSGQTIALVDAYNDPTIVSDLATFSSTEHVSGTGTLTVINEAGVAINPGMRSSSVPITNPGWDLEISLDVEWAHAIAPNANIVLVEANSANLSDLLTGVNVAHNYANVSVVSMSWGSSENLSEEQEYDSYFTTPAKHTGVTFVASSGDSGSPGIWPALSSNVLAVGGTTLTVNPSTGAYVNETAWSDSGGGTSQYELEPTYQISLQSTGKRTAPDVSYDANPSTGFAVYDSVPDEGHRDWTEVGGTSDAAPQWSAIIAIANQDRMAASKAVLSEGQAAIDSLPESDFHDITTGSNGGYSAGPGYDEVTGLGTPIASSVIRDLTTSTVTYTPPAVSTTASAHQQNQILNIGSLELGFTVQTEPTFGQLLSSSFDQPSSAVDSTGSGSTQGMSSIQSASLPFSGAVGVNGNANLQAQNAWRSADSPVAAQVITATAWSSQGNLGSAGCDSFSLLADASLANAEPLSSRSTLTGMDHGPTTEIGSATGTVRIANDASASAARLNYVAARIAQLAGLNVAELTVPELTVAEAIWSTGDFGFAPAAEDLPPVVPAETSAEESNFGMSSALGVVLAGLAFSWAQTAVEENAKATPDRLPQGLQPRRLRRS